MIVKLDILLISPITARYEVSSGMFNPNWSVSDIARLRWRGCFACRRCVVFIDRVGATFRYYTGSIRWLCCMIFHQPFAYLFVFPLCLFLYLIESHCPVPSSESFTFSNLTFSLFNIIRFHLSLPARVARPSASYPSFFDFEPFLWPTGPRSHCFSF